MVLNTKWVSSLCQVQYIPSCIAYITTKLTRKSTAGKGVCLRMWIIENIAGQWPSLAPTKSILTVKERQVNHILRRMTMTTFLLTDYLGDPKKPPLSAPRQDKATSIGITEARPRRALSANVCIHTNRSMSTRAWHIPSSFPSLWTIIFWRTDHSHCIRQQQLSWCHHGVVGHINKHIEDGHCHHGADYCQRDGSDEKSCAQRDKATSWKQLVFDE